MNLKEPRNIEEFKIFLQEYIDGNVKNCKKFTDLYTKKYCNDLEQELKYIFSVRLHSHLIYFIRLHILLCLQIPDNPGNCFRDINPFDMAEEIAEEQFSIYIKEIQKRGIKALLAEGKEGNARAIFKLVLWDKSAIGLDFVIKHMAASQLEGDRGFIDKLADSLKQKSYNKKKDKNKEYVRVLRYLIPFTKIKLGLTARETWKWLNERKEDKNQEYQLPSLADMMREEIFKDEGASSLDDIDNFIKFLRRNSISMK